ncbi:MAG: DUF2279 domain-containing protein [Bacteroidota bacterium]
MSRIFTMIIIAVTHYTAFAQEDSSVEMSKTKLAIVSGVSASFIVAGHIQNYDAWWKGKRSAFHFADDGVKYLHADKLGHNYFTFVMSDVVGNSFHWTGIEKSLALFYGGSIALLFQLYVEAEDGTHPDLGFSVGDGIADITGAYYPLLQNEFPYLKNFTFKYSIIDAGNVSKGKHKTVIDDYESQYFWCSAKIPYLIFPSDNFLANFFNIAIGYSVKGIEGNKSNAHSELYLAFDYDFEAIPIEGEFASVLKHIFNYVHFPSPMIRISPSVVTYGLRM